MPKIGAHVSAAGGLENSLKKAQDIGAEATQIFIAPPQMWVQTKQTEEKIAVYKALQQETNIGPNFIHGTYLVNLGTQNPEHLQKSIDWLTYALNMATNLDMDGVIFHPGSHKGVGFEAVLPQIIEALKTILNNTSVIMNDSEESQDETDGSRIVVRDDTEREQNDTNRLPFLILETSAGAGNSIGDKFEELGQIIKGVNNPRLKICIDTCHVYSAGYDVKTLIGLNDVLEEFDQTIGLQNLAAIHANDTKFDYKSGKDRHENIGEGFLGEEGFTNMINHSKLKDVPFILEVPGFADNGPDIENVTKLKSLLN